eukprot:1707967-Lingulodinium_polyedra.AAC.1
MTTSSRSPSSLRGRCSPPMRMKTSSYRPTTLACSRPLPPIGALTNPKASSGRSCSPSGCSSGSPSHELAPTAPMMLTRSPASTHVRRRKPPG